MGLESAAGKNYLEIVHNEWKDGCYIQCKNPWKKNDGQF